MHISLSEFLQLKFNIFIYHKLGWGVALLYIIFLEKLYFFFNRKERSKIEGAIETVFEGRKSKSEIKSIKKEVLRGTLSHYYEKLFNAYERIEGLKSFFEESIEVHCLNKLDNALRDGKGVLFVTGHYGGIEYIPIFLALNEYPISVIVKFKTKELKNTLYLKTKDLGLKIIDANQKNGILSSVIRDLKANRIVFIECDEIQEWRPSQKEKISFLGKTIGVDKTIDIIQRRAGAGIIFGILHRFNLGKYSLIIESHQDILLRFGKTPSSVGEAVLEFFEQYIYYYPEEWYQWKNYLEIKALPVPGIKVERSTSLSMLKPAVGEVP